MGPQTAVTCILGGVSLHHKPALATIAVIPPFPLLAFAVVAQVDIIGPIGKGGVWCGAIAQFAFAGKLTGRAFTAVGASDLKAHTGC